MSSTLSRWKQRLHIFSITALMLLAGGCGTVGQMTRKPADLPIPPKPPSTRWQTVEDVLGGSEVKPHTQGEDALPDFHDKMLGVNDFDGDPKGGPLLSNNYWFHILPASQAKKIKVADRSQTEKLIRELELTDSKFASLSPTEKAQRLGKLLNADYLWFGSITEYHSAVQQISLSEVFLPGEIERYRKDYEAYVEAAKKVKSDLQAKINDPMSGMLGTAQAYQNELHTLMQDEMQVKKPDDLESMLRSKPLTANVTSVGITANVIKVDSGEKVWVFDASTRGLTLESTNDNLISKMLKLLFKNTPSWP